jgi:hypothetical protein
MRTLPGRYIDARVRCDESFMLVTLQEKNKEDSMRLRWSLVDMDEWIS